MEEDERWRLRGFMDMSKNRRKVLAAHQAHDDPMKPTQIADKQDLSLEVVSRRLSDLCEHGLVKLLNPDQQRDRYYRLTERGEEFLEEYDPAE